MTETTTQPTTTTKRIGVKSITLDWTENALHESLPITFFGWDYVNAFLRRMSESAPNGGAYNKTGFTVTFEDGKTYSGRYDLVHFTRETPDLRRHVRDFVTFSAGVRRPAHMSEESYRDYLAATEEYSPAAMWRNLYDNYDVGIIEPEPEPEPVETPPDPNAEILAERQRAYDAVEGPRVGDYVVMPDGHLERFSHDWGESIQTCYGGSFYLGDGYASFSGALNPSIPKDKLTDTGETKEGSFWFFSNNQRRAHNGIDVQMPCRVYAYEPVEDTRPEPERMLTSETAYVGQRVEVWQHPNVQPAPYQGEAGEILGVCAEVSYAAVKLDGYGEEPVFIPIPHLIEER